MGLFQFKPAIILSESDIRASSFVGRLSKARNHRTTVLLSIQNRARDHMVLGCLLKLTLPLSLRLLSRTSQKLTSLRKIRIPRHEHVTYVTFVGAGAGSLAAARELAANNVKVLILGAREKNRSRFYTQHPNELNFQIDWCAKFVNGVAKEIHSFILN
jgi:hypothetical protein